MALEPLNGYGQSKQLFDIDAALMARMGCRPPQWAGLKFFNVYGPNEYHKAGQRSVAVQLFEQISASGRANLFRSHHADYEDGGSCVTSYGSAIALTSCLALRQSWGLRHLQLRYR